MEPDQLNDLQNQLNESIELKEIISTELEETLHEVGQYSERLTRLNSMMALLETSHESDEVVARKIDVLKEAADKIEQVYKELMSKEIRLQKAELDAISTLSSAQSALKIAQLKSGKH